MLTNTGRKIIAVIDTSNHDHVMRRYLASAPDARREAERVSARDNAISGFDRYRVVEMLTK